MSTTLKKILPYFTSGIVVKGFGRGSKQLGVPTANFPDDVVDRLPEECDLGIYYGWARVDSGPVYKMVMSIGMNPFYRNVKKSMETHIIHEFPADFYGSVLKVVITGYLRPEKDFTCVEDLKTAIWSDINEASCLLDKLPHLTYKQHWFLQQKNGVTNHHNGYNL